MLFFLFACLGNATYVLSILAYDPARGRYGRYLVVNLSWLAGSAVTLLMDLAVFAQYFLFRAAAADEDDDEGGGSPADDGAWDSRPLLERYDTTGR
ncbi:hypothetical protein CDD83_59 [Cordyceps sp. RAO-2017]|nr:hypothetical protein CDD83_59 [Cordyceps sp. RAO-2017]